LPDYLVLNIMNINKRNAIITFDYEVFLGRQTGTIENCVIKPTKLILDTLVANKAKAIFFVDATWLLFLKENSCSGFQLVTSQLKEIISSGSSVELHLHPQWLQAYVTGGEIVFKTFENYKLHSLSREKIIDLFQKSIDLLESITEKEIRCFRAGGFCIEPFTRIKEAFELFKIKYDFSVVPGTFFSGDKLNDYDFSDAPRFPFYSFNDNVNIVESTGSFVEIPLSTYRNNPVYRIINKLILLIKKDKAFGDGIGIQEKKFWSVRSLKTWLQFSKGILSLDKTWNLLFRYFLKVHFVRSNLLVIISHPKTVSLEAIENLKYVTINYNTLSSSDLDSFIY
jgi:hypothetical protein